MFIKIIFAISIMCINVLFAVDNTFDYKTEIKSAAIQVNQEILIDRHIIVNNLYSIEKEKYLKNKYGISNLKNMKQVFSRVNTINLDLLLAQVELESNYGKSRFALEANNYLGIWTYDKNKKGLVPSKRTEGLTHKVQQFNTIYDCVYRYAELLNSTKPYSAYRLIRVKTEDPYLLAKGLQRYSADKKYIDKIHHLLKKLQTS